MTPTVVTSPVGCPRFFVSQAVSSRLCPSTYVVPSRSVSSDLDTLTLVFELYVRLRERQQWDSDTCVFLGEFPTEPVTSEAHPYPHRLRPVRGRRTRIKYVIGLTGLAEAFRHSWYQKQEISGMADRRDWGGGGDDPEESTQRMIERIWESLTDIRARMDQQASLPPVTVPSGDGETVPIAPVLPRVEVPFVAPVPPPPPVLLAEEPVGESGSGSFRLPQQSVGASKGKAPAGPSSSGFGKWGQKLKQAFKGKGRGWGGRQQFQQGRGRPEVEESQQSTARQPITPPGYRCYNCNQPGHLIRKLPLSERIWLWKSTEREEGDPDDLLEPLHILGAALMPGRVQNHPRQASEVYEKLSSSSRMEDEKKVPTLFLPHSENATTESDATIDASTEADALPVYRGANDDCDIRFCFDLCFLRIPRFVIVVTDRADATLSRRREETR
ncbi:hypothetical protein Taro_024489 [Colocasia esculenta]|uniref:CCHC-type domain-containing protein n=1 Tax=Colocasia esculenta TaxID=4460 RepID=A0A843V0G8_COLES|nr:hypothetical protein [Colocasia esculenta]